MKKITEKGFALLKWPFMICAIQTGLVAVIVSSNRVSDRLGVIVAVQCIAMALNSIVFFLMFKEQKIDK